MTTQLASIFLWCCLLGMAMLFQRTPFPAHSAQPEGASYGISKMQLRLKSIRKRDLWLVLICLGLVQFLPAVSYSGPSVDEKAVKPKKIFIISIGINTYQHEKISSLRFAKADALALADAMEKAAPGVTVHKQVLLNDKATRSSIEAAFNEVIAQSKQDDQFVFFFSGHSTHSPDPTGRRRWEVIFLPTDAFPEEESGAKTIPAELLKAWTSRIQAGKQLLIFDTTGTSEVVAAFASRVESEGAQALKMSGRSVMIMGPEGLSYERDELQHGQFTFDLLEGLSGNADAFPKDDMITAGELDVYARGRSLMHSHSAGMASGIASAKIGEDFAVAWLKDSRGVQVFPVEPQVAESRDEPKGRDYALLIATDDYESYKHLSNPINDARAIATDLKDIYGLETRLVENPSLEEIFKVLGEYIEREYSPNDQLLIFIAGHGMYIENTKEGFLIARNSKARQEDIYGTTYLPHTRLRDIIDRIPTKHIFLIIDACFGGTFDQRIADAGDRADDLYADVSASEVKARKIKYKSRRYLTSGGKEYVPDGRPGQHSPFARKVLEALRSYGGKEGYLTIGKILQYVEKVTPEPRAGEFGSNEPGGDLVLIKK